MDREVEWHSARKYVEGHVCFPKTIRYRAGKLGKLLPSSFYSHVEKEIRGPEKQRRSWILLLRFRGVEPRSILESAKEVSLCYFVTDGFTSSVTGARLPV